MPSSTGEPDEADLRGTPGCALSSLERTVGRFRELSAYVRIDRIDRNGLPVWIARGRASLPPTSGLELVLVVSVEPKFTLESRTMLVISSSAIGWTYANAHRFDIAIEVEQ